MVVRVKRFINDVCYIKIYVERLHSAVWVIVLYLEGHVVMNWRVVDCWCLKSACRNSQPVVYSYVLFANPIPFRLKILGNLPLRLLRFIFLYLFIEERKFYVRLPHVVSYFWQSCMESVN